MTSLQSDLDRIGTLLKEAIDSDLAGHKPHAGRREHHAGLRKRGTRLKWAALAGGTGVAAGVSALVLIGGSEQYAFAGWSAAPTTPATGQVTAAETVCQARIAQGPPSNKGVDAASLVPELSDVRGPYTVTVFGGSSQSVLLCVSAPGATSLRWIAAPGATVGNGAIAIDQVSFLDRDSQPYTLVEGRVGSGVTSATLVLGDGTKVTTTIGNGLLIAWWPGTESITSATVVTTAGVSSQPLNLPGPAKPSSKPAPSSPPTHSSCTPTASVACAMP